MYRIFIILQRTGDSVEGFIFSQKNLTLDQGLNFYSHLELMHKFAFYFKREAKQLIEQMMSDGFNIKQERGDSFFLADPRQPLVRKNPHFLKVLRTISPLSDREQECLSLFQQGFSAQATAAVLHLSQRTVEHYFDTIKNKLGCSSKWELLAR